MSLHEWRRSLVKQACEAALKLPMFQDGDTNEECDRDFRDFIESISMTAEELAAIVSKAEFSVAEAERSLQDAKIDGPQRNRSSLGRAVPGVGYRRVRAAV